MRPSGRLVSWKAAQDRHAAVFALHDATPETDWAHGYAQVAAQLPGLRSARNGQHGFGTQADPSLRLRLPDHVADLF
jgi:hypothetical protein